MKVSAGTRADEAARQQGAIAIRSMSTATCLAVTAQRQGRAGEVVWRPTSPTAEQDNAKFEDELIEVAEGG
jgi:hypothetical protein